MSLWEKLLTGYRGLLSGLTIAGLAIILAGASISSPILSALFISIGGALFGASFSSLIGRLSGDQFAQDVKDVLEKSLQTEFRSDERLLGRYRSKWHLYSVSKKNEKLFWYHKIIDFSHSYISGKLATSINLSDKSGNEHGYIVDAVIMDDRFLLFTKPKMGTEPVEINIYPFMGLDFFGFHSGFSIRQTWDANHAMLPTVMSQAPLHGCEQEGEIPEELWGKFDDTWRYGMKPMDILLPT